MGVRARRVRDQSEPFPFPWCVRAFPETEQSVSAAVVSSAACKAAVVTTVLTSGGNPAPGSRGCS